MLRSKKLKKVIIILLLCIILVAILAVKCNVLLIDKRYNTIKTYRDTEEQTWSDWYYNDVKYSVAPGLDLSASTPHEDCKEENGFYKIGWNWVIPLLGTSTVYGDSVDDPHYLYCPQRGDKYCVRVKENFDYMDEEYVIFNEEHIFYDEPSIAHERIRKDTEFTFKLKDVYYIDEPFYRESGVEPITAFISHSKSFKRLEFGGRILFVDGEYYVNFTYHSTRATEQTYKAKPEFIGLLKEAGVLEKD